MTCYGVLKYYKRFAKKTDGKTSIAIDISNFKGLKPIKIVILMNSLNWLNWVGWLFVLTDKCLFKIENLNYYLFTAPLRI